jgi:hypothetical protein
MTLIRIFEEWKALLNESAIFQFQKTIFFAPIPVSFKPAFPSSGNQEKRNK